MRKAFRVAAVAAALSIPVSGLSLGLAGTAGAAKVVPKPTAGSSVVCTKFKFKEKTKTKKGVTTTTDSLKISKCYDASGAAVAGEIVSSNPASLESGGALPWSTGVQTVIVPNAHNGLVILNPGDLGNTCAAGATEYVSNGHVGTGTTQTATPIGDVTYGAVCLVGTTLTLAPGTYFEV